MDVVLPFGLQDRTERHRAARLLPLDGHAELAASEAPSTARAVLRILMQCTDRIGPQTQLDGERVASLLPVDRDYLLVQLIRMTFGDVVLLTVTCPAEGCGAQMDLSPDLSDVTPMGLPDAQSISLGLADGRRVRLNWPTSGDLLAASEAEQGQSNRVLIERCLTPDSPAAASLTETDVAALAATLHAQSPRLDLSADLTCVECGTPFRFTYDPPQQLVGALGAARRSILREMHQLALAYNWSLAEILSLSRPMRREFLELIDEDQQP